MDRTPKRKKEQAVDVTRVLVIDDNYDSAFMLSLVIRALGCESQVANSCNEALRVGNDLRPEVIFCDIGMPNIDGYETCRRMRTTDWGKPARIIALTGWGQDSDRKRSEEAGFDAHLVKPVDRGTLLNMLTHTRSE